MNGNNLYVRHEARHFGIKNKEYFKDRVNELRKNNKILRGLYRNLNESEKGCQSRINLVICLQIFTIFCMDERIASLG
jgi:hypothetical protein